MFSVVFYAVRSVFLRALICLTTVLAIAAALVQPALASQACTDINAYWSGGVTPPAGTTLFPEYYGLTAGEVLHYTATSTGSTNAPNDLFGPGFAIYTILPGGNYGIEAEEYGASGAELNLNSQYTVGHPDITIYAWSADPGGGASHVTVTCAPVTPAPTITSLSPVSGLSSGGSSVVITGTNLTGATAVTFGGTNATSFAVNSATQITATAPAHAVGSVDVRVTTAGGMSANSAADDFAYQSVPAAPTIGTATAGDTQASVVFTAGNNGGAAVTTFTATASPGGATGTVSGPTASPITVTGLTNGTAYTFTVAATNARGTSTASAASNSATPKGVQAITFTNPGAQNFGTTPTLTATATSSLTPVFSSSTTGVCTITSGGALTFVSAGTCTINADQAGNTAWNAASTVSQSFSVNALVPGAPSIGTATAGDTQASVSFSAPASNGGAAISGYVVTANPGGATGTGSSSPIVVTGLTNGVAYTFTVTATNSAGTGSASAASGSITPAAIQTITFNAPGPQNFGTTPTLSATASSGLTPIFSSSTTAVCTVTSGGALTFISAGNCIINADQGGNSSYLPAAQIIRSFNVNAVVPGAPSAVSATAGNGQAVVSFSAPASTGGATITGYTVTSNPGNITQTGTTSPITVSGLSNGTSYTFTVVASNSVGNGSTSPASAAVVPAGGQSITFGNPGAQTFGTNPSLTATSDSGLTPLFTSTTPAVCSVTSGGDLSFLTIGSCTIEANQAGDSTYLPAAPVVQTFAVNAAVPDAPTGVSATAGAAQASVAFTAPVYTGGAITGYVVTSSPGGLSASGTASPIVVGGLTNGTAYTFTVQAENTAGPGAASAASNIVVPGLGQTITFVNPGTKTLGTTPTLTASASSGLAVSFASNSPAICTVSGAGSLTLVAAGTCVIEVAQAGDASYLAATNVVQSFSVVATSIVLTPASGALPNAMAGEAYSFSIATSGQSGTVIYALTGGSLPAGMTLNQSTGELTGPLASGATGDHSFTITASDTSGGNASGTFTLKVAARAVTAEDRVVTILPGTTPLPVDLTEGATGGPFTAAVVAGVEPSYAGTATIVMGEFAAIQPMATTRFYLKFAPNPAFTGQAIVTFRLTSALGVSNQATVAYTTTADPVAVAAAFQDLTRDYVTARAALLAAGVDAPGLQERRNMALAQAPGTVSVTPNGNSVSMNFAASTLSLAAFQAMDSLIAAPIDESGINFWIDGTATLHVRSDDGDEHWGSFALLSAGADMLVNKDLLIGLAIHADWMDDLTAASRIAGRGVLVGPYVSAEIGEGVFFDASLLAGRSWNDVSTDIFGGSFQTDRLLAKASLEGQWLISDALVLRPSVQAFYLRESAGAYSVSDGAGTLVVVDGFVLNQFRISAGARLEYTLDLDGGVTLKPFVGGQLGLSLTDGMAGSFARLSTGFDLTGLGQWTLGGTVEADIESEGLKAVSAKARLRLSF